MHGLSCMFGRCIRSIPDGQEGKKLLTDSRFIKGLNNMIEIAKQCVNISTPLSPSGARCKLDRECGESMCCARHHGERVCKQRLVLGESCFVPDGGLAFSINQICPCDEGLLCRGHGEPIKRE